MSPRRRHLFVLFVALLLGGTGSTLAQVQPSPSCPALARTPSPRRTHSATSTAHPTATLVPGPSATPEPPPCPQPSSCGHDPQACCQPPSTTINKLVCTNTGHKHAHARGNKSLHNGGIRWTDILLAAFTLGILIVGVLQWRTMSAQQKIQADALALTRALEMPVLLAEIEGNIADMMRNKEPTAVADVFLINQGRSIARVTQYCARLAIMDAPLPPDPPYGDPPAFRRIVPPRGDRVWISACGQLVPDNIREEFERWFDDRRCLVLFGIVKYMDPFGGEHETRFCRTWFNRVDGPFGPPNWTGQI